MDNQPYLSKFTFKHINITTTSQASQNILNDQNCIVSFVSPGGSSSTARRFMEKTQKMGLVLVSPGRSSVTAKRSLEKFQKPEWNSDNSTKIQSQTLGNS